jgi:hypothetical protein
MFKESTNPLSASDIKSTLKTKIGLNITKGMLILYLKQELNMRYKTIKSIGERNNALESKL